MENNEEITMKKVKRTTSKEKIKKLEAEIIELTNKLKEAENKHLFALAENENLRKRFIKEKELAEHKKMLNTLDPFLYIIQHFNMAVKAMNNNSNIDTIKKGMEIIQMQFKSAFDKLHLTKIETVGKKFNPILHDAATKEYSDTIQQGYITQEWTAGYTYEDKVLKPAGVVVSMGKEPIE